MESKSKNLIIGRQPLIEALKEGVELERIFIAKNASGEIIDTIKELAEKAGVPMNYVPVEKINSFTRNNHQGIIGLKARVKYYQVQDIIDHVNDKGLVPFFIILDSITDVRNIGAIARSAVCFGAQAIIIPDKGVGALQEDAVKASAGALEKIFVCRVNSLMKTVDELRLNGIKVIASEMTADKTIDNLELNEPLAVVMGSEDKGIFAPLMKICDEKFKIQMTDNFESLNVSVAAGIIFNEVFQQRNG